MTPDERAIFAAMNLAIRDLQRRHDMMIHALHVIQERLMLLDASRAFEEIEEGNQGRRH